MLSAFLADKTPFRRLILLISAVSLLSFGCSAVFYNQYLIQSQNNAKDEALYKAQSEWLQNFDRSTVINIEKSILRPVKLQNVDRVQQEQLDILAQSGLELISVRKDSATDKKSKLKYVRTSVTVEGSWEAVTKALNAFERHNLVVITNLELKSDEKISCRMDYNIYYI